MMDNFALVSIVAVLCLVNVTHGKDCQIDEAKGWFDPDNVYQCPSDQTCCIESAKPSCCGNKAMTEETLDQIKLWGTIFAVVLVIAILVCCCRKDNSCCDGDATCCYYLTCRCCCARNRKTADEIEYQKFPPNADSPTPKKKKFFHDTDHPPLVDDGKYAKFPVPSPPPLPPPPPSGAAVTNQIKPAI